MIMADKQSEQPEPKTGVVRMLAQCRVHHTNGRLTPILLFAVFGQPDPDGNMLRLASEQFRQDIRSMIMSVQATQSGEAKQDGPGLVDTCFRKSIQVLDRPLRLIPKQLNARTKKPRVRAIDEFQ
jgi:hypothetical protein